MKEKNQCGQNRKQSECAIQCAKNEENYLQEKKAIANGFSIIEQDECLEDDEKSTLRGLLCNYNGLLDSIAESKNDPDTIIERRLICSFKLWIAVIDIEETIKTLQRMESYCKDEDIESLGNARSLLSQFDKDIKRPID